MASTEAPWEQLWYVWEHLGPSPNQWGNPKLTLRDAWVLMHIHSKDLRHYLRFSLCTLSDKNTLHVRCIDYCSLSTSKSYYTTQHLIQHSIVCITILMWTKENCEWFNNKSSKSRNNNPTMQSNDINQIWFQCHSLNLPSHEGCQTQEYTIHQWRKEAGGAPCISEKFEPGEWVNLNSNSVCLNLWYLQGWNREVSSQWIKMEFKSQDDEFRGKRDVLPGKEKCLMWSAGWERGVLMVM